MALFDVNDGPPLSVLYQFKYMYNTQVSKVDNKSQQGKGLSLNTRLWCVVNISRESQWGGVH